MGKKVVADIGVIVGRFQVHDLHEGHKEIISTVVEQHKKVLVFLGVSPVLCTQRNPLDFLSRQRMIQAAFPTVSILPIEDTPNDNVWSRLLDKAILKICPLGSIVLYGSRESFLDIYDGIFETKELTPSVYASGTEIRKGLAQELMDESIWRAGVIYASANRYPTAYPTVDVAVLKDELVLLVRKPHEKKWRFPGGFVDPIKDKSFEHAARREISEECGIECGEVRYLASRRQDDWRYKGEKDKIFTTLYSAKYMMGAVTPADDVSEAKWFEINNVTRQDIEHVHLELFDKLLEVRGKEIAK